MTRIGFVGAGRMGLPMCANLVAAGHDVVVADADSEAEAQVRELGARWAPSTVVAGREADVVITMLPGPAETVDVATMTMPEMRRGATWIDMGSNDPPTAASLDRLGTPRGIAVLDAPVGGGPEAAGDGRLQLFIGGEKHVLQKHLPLLGCLADPAQIHHMGGRGCGYTAKLLVNLLWFGQVAATTEALLLAASSGIDLGAMHGALAHSAVGGRFVENDIAALLRGDYLRSFGLDGCYRELAAISDLAAAAETPFVLSSLVTDIYRQALEHFGPVDGELMAAALLELRSGITLRADPGQ